MRTGSYWLQLEPTEPEQYVLDLNKDLTSADDDLSKFLPPTKIKYLFSGISQIIITAIIRNLSRLHDKRLNKNGTLQISRNLFALQQNLTNIIVTKDGQFDRARQYFELLNLNEEDLSQYQADNPNLFSSEEYTALLEIQSLNRRK